ncbi:MAG: hypothetical protein ACKO16_06680 [Gemmataceae bacterium]
MNNKEENIKKLASVLADVFILWMIEIGEQRCKTKGHAEDETNKYQGSPSANAGNNLETFQAN